MPSDLTPVLADSVRLCARSQELQAHSQELCLRAQQVRARTDVFRQPRLLAPDPTPTPMPATPTPPDRQVIATDVLRVMRNVLDHLPIDLQVSIVRALTARTLLKAAERQAAPFVRSV